MFTPDQVTVTATWTAPSYQIYKRGGGDLSTYLETRSIYIYSQVNWG